MREELVHKLLKWVSTISEQNKKVIEATSLNSKVLGVKSTQEGLRDRRAEEAKIQLKDEEQPSFIVNGCQ